MCIHGELSFGPQGCRGPDLGWTLPNWVQCVWIAQKYIMSRFSPALIILFDKKILVVAPKQTNLQSNCDHLIIIDGKRCSVLPYAQWNITESVPYIPNVIVSLDQWGAGGGWSERAQSRRRRVSQERRRHLRKLETHPYVCTNTHTYRNTSNE